MKINSSAQLSRIHSVRSLIYKSVMLSARRGRENRSELCETLNRALDLAGILYEVEYELSQLRKATASPMDQPNPEEEALIDLTSDTASETEC